MLIFLSESPKFPVWLLYTFCNIKGSVVAVGSCCVSADPCDSIICFLIVPIFAFLEDMGCPAIVLAGVGRVSARRFTNVAGVAADIDQDFQLIISIFGISSSPFDGLISPLMALTTSQLGLSNPTIVLIGISGVFAVPCW